MNKKFCVSSGKLRVTDPCYDLSVWCSGALENVKNGDWSYVVDYYSGRVASLTVFHTDSNPEDVYTKTDIDVGVDSGQCGFFDHKAYELLHVGDMDTDEESEQKDAFYDKICDGTLGQDQVGLVSFGVATSSGYGDGSYDCYVKKDSSGFIVASKLVFIDE